MDKFSAEKHNDEENIAVQACIDEVKEKSVYVITIANELYDGPDSLVRSGRFDRKITVNASKGDEAIKIIEYYLSTKVVSDDLTRATHIISKRVCKMVMNGLRLLKPQNPKQKNPIACHRSRKSVIHA